MVENTPYLVVTERPCPAVLKQPSFEAEEF